MKTILFASLITAMGCAGPVTETPTPIKPEPTAACVATGDHVFEIDNKKDAGDSVTSAAILYATGAWTFEDSTGTKRNGCVAVADVAALRTRLAAASWTSEPDTGMRCMAMSAAYTEYSALGKSVWIARVCDGNHLDATSEKTLQAAITLLTSATH